MTDKLLPAVFILHPSSFSPSALIINLPFPLSNLTVTSKGHET